MSYVRNPATADRNAAICRRYQELRDMGSNFSGACDELGLRWSLKPSYIETIVSDTTISGGSQLDQRGQQAAALDAAWPRGRVDR